MCQFTSFPTYRRKKAPPSQRRIMRTYGARFRCLEGEPVDPDSRRRIGKRPRQPGRRREGGPPWACRPPFVVRQACSPAPLK